MLGRLLAGVLIGAAAIPVPAVAAGPSAAVGKEKGSEQAQSITLITGDVVRLAPVEGGKFAASVTPAAGRERVSFHTFEGDGGIRVVPSDAVPLIADGRVDAELFDVEHLVAEGYGDADSASLPLIVKGGTAGLRTAGAALAMTSIGATAVRPAKSSLAEFWKSQGGQARLSGATQIFLDGKVKAALDKSTAQIGAPTAWQQGLDGRGVKVAILDTGIDATHPDLAGKIAGTANFSSSPDVVDRFGHGTHVASTIAGSGAASGGSRKGVAYGSDLLIGKVLGDDGTGYESEIIAGMQWAVDSGAKVVNMSLGGGATDGLDPMSLAVDEISAASGALFVVAAGNEGADSSVGTPGAATDALTVGAVDRTDQIASFSSRGPRLGDLGLKPEITAPGVDIVAARAAGTTMGEPVDEFYTAASGTSMATPHVAGAAAIVAQQHPDWSGAKIKEALVSTAKTTTGPDVYAQGAGRVDLARVTTQAVTGTPIADYGVHTKGTSPATESKTITYTNSAATPVTLKLTAPTAVKLSAATVTVPAKATATVTATIDFAAQKPGKISGWISATATGITVTTAVGAVLDGPSHKVTVKAVNRSGQPTTVPVLDLRGDDSRFDTLGWLTPAGNTYELQEGTYLLDALIEDGAPLDEQVTFVTIPELKVDKDITVLVDARKGTPITIETPKPAEQQTVLSYYIHRTTGTGRSIAHGVMHFSTVQKVNVVPTKKVVEGSFEFSSRWQLVAPRVQTKVPGVSEPIDANLVGESPWFDGTRKYQLVKWGTKDVRGKAVLIPGSWETDENEQVIAAAKAGAAVALVVRPADHSAWTVFNPTIVERLPIVALAVAYDDGQRLVKKAPSTLDLTLTTSSPYLYDVLQVSKDRIPEKVVYKVTAANSMRITSSYADNGGFDWVREQRFGWRPWQTVAWNDTSRPVSTPSTREEWVSAGDSVWRHAVAHEYPWNTEGPLLGGFQGATTSYKAGAKSEKWGAAVVRPANVGSYRSGDVLHLQVPEFVDSDGHYELAEYGDNATGTLSRDGKQIADLAGGIGDVTTTAGQATYKLKVGTARSNEDWVYGTRTESEWTFKSKSEGDLPLLGVNYTPQALGVNLAFSAKLKSLKVEVSTNDGASWSRAVVIGTTAVVLPGRTPVSLRVTAEDTAGNALTQTVIRAYGRS
ncbi:S8 family serine peptidase [Winogradskya consettensis]|uniref:Peptidase n=1 Tax=Winogradskya consettensis TaxID=113560 RepID=A0A919T012_9ACTN|nr:S8 family serine peptidase [Actinoplanes consettensis]GIM80511.1 peptidase [Actinoplanes consettensis]